MLFWIAFYYMQEMSNAWRHEHAQSDKYIVLAEESCCFVPPMIPPST